MRAVTPLTPATLLNLITHLETLIIPLSHGEIFNRDYGLSTH